MFLLKRSHRRQGYHCLKNRTDNHLLSHGRTRSLVRGRSQPTNAMVIFLWGVIMSIKKAKAYNKVYREIHKEEQKAYQKVYREIHKEEQKAYQKVYREIRKEEIKAYNTDYYKDHQEEIKDQKKGYSKDNKEKISTYLKSYRKNNPLKIRGNKAKRRASEIHRTPKWLTIKDLKDIKMFYENCPVGYHVDHIIPLQGKFVSGLHVLSNLQYLTPQENFSKSNKYSL